ncbi:MAG: DUF3048 domain-containing protein [Mycobacteriales bacterium]
MTRPNLRPPVPHPAAVVLLGVTLLAACGGAAADPTATPTPEASSAPVSAPATATAPKATATAAKVSPLTGTAPLPTGNVVAVKIDNSPLARPYFRGLGVASLIYQEVMEGGATRFLAVYAPATGSEVGPIRSVREGDIELLQQFGKVALGASGGNTGVLATVAVAEKRGLVLDVSYDTVPGPYRKGERRKDAINFFTSPEKIDKAKPSGTKVKDIGLRFGPLPAGAGFPAKRVSVPFSKISQVRVEYDAASGRYAVYQDGDRMKDYAPTNVIIQHAQIRDTKYVDVLGNPTPFTSTVGTGAAVVLRDGRRLSGSWRRIAPHSGTRFLDDKDRDLPLKPGATLVLLVPAGTTVSAG